MSDTTRQPILGLLRSQAGASSLATGHIFIKGITKLIYIILISKKAII
jgi:hypothetical protein